MKRMFLILILFYFQSSYSQNQRTEVIGVIKFDLLPVDNIHVLNLSSRIGTISESNGLFKIDVKDGDSILFSSIQFQKKKLLINQNHLKNGIIYVNLENQIYKLDTVFIKNHNLTGIILVDLKNSPKDNNVKTNFKWEKILNWSTPPYN